MELEEIKKLLLKVKPFNEISDKDLDNILQKSRYKKIETGERIIQFDKIPEFLPILLKGSLRLLTLDENKYPITLERIEKPRLLGWSNILRGKCEISIIASNDSEILLLPSILFIEIKNISSIKKYISQVLIWNSKKFNYKSKN